MRFFQQLHGFYGGVELHARTMHVCVVDSGRSDSRFPSDPFSHDGVHSEILDMTAEGRFGLGSPLPEQPQ